MAGILVIGGSRGVGLDVVRQGLDAGHHIRALARSADDMSAGGPSLTKIRGDARDEQVLTQALQGMDAVIQTLGVKASCRRTLRPVDLFSAATSALLSTMKTSGVKRLIALTGFGAGDSKRHGGPLYRLGFSLFLRQAYADKDRQEKLIQESNLDWTIARPGILYDGAHTRDYQILKDPSQWRLGFIARANVADFLLKQVGDDHHLGETPVLIGASD